MIPLSTPNLGEAEAESVARVVREGWVSTAGPQVAQFEANLAQYCGSKFAVATASGTAALHLALLGAGVQPGHRVIVPNLTFVATANAVAYCGAQPILVDVHPQTGAMDLDLLQEWLSANCRLHNGECRTIAEGALVSACIYVHPLGYAGPVAQAQALAEAWYLVLIEDAAAAMGSFHQGQHAGTTGTFGCLSFNGNKVMTTGGGGAILLNDPAQAEYLRHLSTQARRHYAEYLHDQTGYNYRMTNMAAALGIAQLARMEEFLAHKHATHQTYQQELQGAAQLFPASGDAPNHWLNCILHPDARILEDYLEVMGIEARKLWIPLSKLPMFGSCTLISKEHHALSLYEQSLCLPSSTHLSPEDLNFVIETVRTFLQTEEP